MQFFSRPHWPSDHMTRSRPLIGQPSFPTIWWWWGEGRGWPIRGLELIMWSQGKWGASKKTASNGANRQTDRHRDSMTESAQWGRFSKNPTTNHIIQKHNIILVTFLAGLCSSVLLPLRYIPCKTVPSTNSYFPIMTFLLCPNIFLCKNWYVYILLFFDRK